MKRICGSVVCTFLCSGESDYGVPKSLIDHLEFNDQRTQLTDGLYSVLKQLRESEKGTLRRLLLIADGVDNKTVGCANRSASATEELQNLFALSRLTSGASYYLPEVEETMEIVNGVIAWNSSVQLSVQLPGEVCDGMNKVLRVTGGTGGDTYLAELKMPLAEVQEPQEEPEPAPAPPEPVPEPERRFPWAIPLVFALAAAAGVLAVMLWRNKKNRERIEASPDVKPPVEAPAVTEMLTSSGGEDRTEGIWNAAPSLRLIFQDLDVPSRRIEAVLSGEILVGRDAAACQVTFTEPSVARKQCRIFQQSSWVMLDNLSQSNISWTAAL